ncbi:hypothetical protein EYF80_003496 [Liparis tanakae]|uniref:Uncharacterized protein n=1 Tax=Liparis tanakae TaxID=230148 RepID=A0A4Z2J7B2_9TELE|nr:hypothetical protein EYF80_003496 [Liparis tanakae]
MKGEKWLHLKCCHETEKGKRGPIPMGRHGEEVSLPGSMKASQTLACFASAEATMEEAVGRLDKPRGAFTPSVI